MRQRALQIRSSYDPARHELKGGPKGGEGPGRNGWGALGGGGGVRQRALQIHSFYDPARGKGGGRTRGTGEAGAEEQWLGCTWRETRRRRREGGGVRQRALQKHSFNDGPARGLEGMEDGGGEGWEAPCSFLPLLLFSSHIPFFDLIVQGKALPFTANHLHVWFLSYRQFGSAPATLSLQLSALFSMIRFLRHLCFSAYQCNPFVHLCSYIILHCLLSSTSLLWCVSVL